MDFNKMAEQVKNNPQLVQQITQSPDGQALMQLLSRDGGEHFTRAVQEGEGGNFADMTRLLKDVMSSAEGRALLVRLGQQLQQ